MIAGRVPESLKLELNAMRHAIEDACRDGETVSARHFAEMYLEICADIPEYQEICGVLE